jgi:poly-gamma-glutamate capsule biosynthesis protein CapA/YwtB (metallophosphatase superfamily)
VAGETVSLFLGGDVMTGRGVDQVLPHPGDPRLWEDFVGDARDYVRLAEAASGPVPRPVAFTWPWGDALPVLDGADARIVNLETAVTRAGTPARGKAVHYRMAPANLPCLSAARPDVCALANNHVLDFGDSGLAETRDSLAAAGLRTAGAGADDRSAQRPAVVPARPGGVVVASSGTASSGIPAAWGAGPDHPGVDLLPDLSAGTAGRLAGRLHRAARPGDIIVASLHWGSNWGYDIPDAHVDFAHHLLDAGVHVVHGHSSHHPRPVEIYRGRLILYGCGDLIDDYEGITGYRHYRDDLRLLHLATLDPGTGNLLRLRMVPMRAHRLRLRHATRADAAHLHRALGRTSARFGTRIDLTGDGELAVRLP